jgi:cytoskeletal protein CcmA (bactofilin family)
LKTKINNNIGKDEVTIVSTGVILEGKLNSNGNVRIDGTVNGDIKAMGNVTVGESGEINGEISAENIIIGGRINGTVNAREKLTIESKSVLTGDIITKILEIEAGAKFDGKSTMNAQTPSFSRSQPENNG